MVNQSLKLFTDFISIQSVSADSKRHNEILKAVEFLKKEIKALGFEINIYQSNGCPPLIVAKPAFVPLSGTSARQGKTIGVYAHYDVQPEDPVDLWNSPPFTLTKKNGRIFGRGVADDKGHIIQILMAIRKLVETQNFASLQTRLHLDFGGRSNIVLIFEGEEEVGSPNFEELIKKDPIIKKIDVFYVVDMGMKDKSTPQIFYGLRGIVAFELKIKTSETDLHSGVYGNRALNPAQLLADLMSKMKDGLDIKIPGFYDDVRKTSQEEKDLLLKSSDTLVSKIYPALDINGMSSGYTGEGSKTIIPATAMVKFSIRLVPNQNHKKIGLLVKKFIKDHLPKGADYKLKIYAGSNAFYTDFKNPYAKKTAQILSQVFQGETRFNRSGGSVGAAEILQRLYKKPVILIGFTLPDDNIHAPNENIDEETFEKGITALEKILMQ